MHYSGYESAFGDNGLHHTAGFAVCIRERKIEFLIIKVALLL